jgi:branched-chain amino acid transport system substrate-binding protein
MYRFSLAVRKTLIGSAAALIAATGFSGHAIAQDKTGITDKTIKIGMYGPLTGSQSSWGYPVQNGAIMVYKEINEKGGIHGRKIEVVQEDGACDSAKTLAAVKKLVHREKVFMINSGICSGPSMAARQELINNKVPFMLFAASLDAITAPVSRYLFTVAPTGRHDGLSIGEFVKSIPGVKRVAIVGHADDWAKSKSDAFKSVAKQANLEIVADETLEKNVTDSAAQVLAIKRANADAVVMLTYPGPTAAFLRDAHKYGLKAKFVGNNSLIDLGALAERVGNPDALQTTFVTATIVGSLGSPELAPYEQLLKKHYPKETIKADSFYGTASAITVVEALKRAGKDLTREKFIDALEKMQGFNAGIAPCSISFSPENHQGCQTQTVWTQRGTNVVNVGPTWKELK